MANVTFARGNRENLPAGYVDGRFIVAKDEHALYLDIGEEERIRFGDFVEVETFSDLSDIQNPVTTALYYVKDTNVLAKHDGKTWKQINPDTGAVKVEKQGSGNAVSDITYDEDSRTLKLVMATYTTSDDVDGKITAKVGDLEGQETVKAYVDEKTKNIASESEIEKIRENINKKADLGTDADSGDTVSLYGVKKHAEEKAKEEAETVKTTVVGVEGDLADAETIHGAKKYTDEQIKAKLSSTYKPGGSAEANKFATAPTETDEGKVFNASEEFETNENFVDAASKKYPAGTNVVAIKEDGGTYKWDVLSGFVDLTDYATSAGVDTKIGAAKDALVGVESTITADTIKEAAKEAETYADGKDTALKKEIIGNGDATSETIKDGVAEAKRYTDEKITSGLAWGEF